MLTLHIPAVDLETLGEADKVTECFRLFGLKKAPASETRVCDEFEKSVISIMPVALRCIADDAERRWHELLEQSPRLMDHFIGAVFRNTIFGRWPRSRPVKTSVVQ